MGTRDKIKMILVLIPSQHLGGAELRALEISKEIISSGFSGTVAFSPCKELQSLKKEFESIGFLYEAASINDTDYQKPKFLKMAPLWLNDSVAVLRSFFSTLSLLRKYKPKNVFLIMPEIYSSTGAIMACAILKVPTTIRFALVSDKVPFKIIKIKIIKWAKKRKQNWIVVSKNNRYILSKYFAIKENKIHVIYNGYKSITKHCSPSHLSVREELGLPKHSTILLTVGSLDSRKNHSILLPIIPNIIKRYPNAYFLWAGTGPLYNEYSDLICTFGIDKNVLLLKHRKDVFRLLNESDLFVFPSTAEGLSNALLEAITYKIPVITTNVSSMPELIKHNYSGLLVTPNDSTDFMLKIFYALEHKDMMINYAENAAKGLKKFSREKMLNRHLQLISNY